MVPPPLASRTQAGVVGLAETWGFEVEVEVGIEAEVETEVGIEVGISASGSEVEGWKLELRASSEASVSAQIGGGE